MHDCRMNKATNGENINISSCKSFANSRGSKNEKSVGA